MNKKNKRHLGPKVIKVILLALNLVAALMLLMAFFAHLIRPSISSWIAFCGLAFPYILIANGVFCVLWLFIRYPYAFISLSLILLNVNNIDKHFQLREAAAPINCSRSVKVMSYNAQLFGVYTYDEKQRDEQKEKIFDFLRAEKPDITCFQEYFWDKSGKLNFPTTDSILSILSLKKDNYHYYQYFPTNLREEYYYGLAIFSRYKIIRADPIIFPDSSANSAIFVDIKYKSDTIRVYNLHLASIHMDNVDYSTGKQIFNSKFDDPYLNQKTKKIFKKIKTAFITRQQQSITIHKHIDSCHYPIIICGDFNDSPASYSYHKIGHRFKDTFRESGKGTGYTYNGDAFPKYRIDYIFHDKQYNSYLHTVAKDLNVSDHYPVFCTLSLQKKW